MKKYINAELDVILFDDSDVIATSNDPKQEKSIDPVKGPDLPDNWA